MRRTIAAVVGAAVAFIAATLPARRSAVPDARMMGAWEGEAEIFVNWTAARRLAVRLVVAPDGRVTGRIGDARLVKGRLRRNRGSLGRWLHVKTDYIVRGALDGPVIAAEGVRRDGVSIPLDWNGEVWDAAVHTTGFEFGGKERMILTAGRLVLRRAPDVSGAP
jgi:hypothetical protein